MLKHNLKSPRRYNKFVNGASNTLDHFPQGQGTALVNHHSWGPEEKEVAFQGREHLRSFCLSRAPSLPDSNSYQK
jgi:hypothetical protein